MRAADHQSDFELTKDILYLPKLSYGLLFVRILEDIDCIMITPTTLYSQQHMKQSAADKSWADIKCILHDQTIYIETTDSRFTWLFGPGLFFTLTHEGIWWWRNSGAFSQKQKWYILIEY